MRIDIPVTRFRRRDRETMEVGWGRGRWADGVGENMREKAKHLSYFFYKDTAWDLYAAHEVHVMFVRSSRICFPPAPPREKNRATQAVLVKVKKIYIYIFSSGKKRR